MSMITHQLTPLFHFFPMGKPDRYASRPANFGKHGLQLLADYIECHLAGERKTCSRQSSIA